MTYLFTIIMALSLATGILVGGRGTSGAVGSVNEKGDKEVQCLSPCRIDDPDCRCR
ncbi:MAG TPA: hypothetical protein VIB00_06575 [Pyrinomonadaceae bacterium]